MPESEHPSIAVTVAPGDGIGPEITEATLRVLGAAGAPIAPEFVDIGLRPYEAGHGSGIPPAAWDSIRRTRVLLKGPVTTPQGSGFKSVNVTLRKTLGLYANVRPCVSYHPFVRTLHPKLDVVIVRENEEDLYAGIEHRQTDEVFQCLKLVTRPGCERIMRHAFAYARANGRRRITCMTKDNIMKMTDGLFHRVFDEFARLHPDIECEHQIIDIGAARLATRPERYDVIVTLNLYGDILSDIAAELSGSVGLAPSSNIGDHAAMFEAIHGSAPDIAGRGIANPSGLLLAAVQMLVHLGQPEVAARVHNAWLTAIEDGVQTADLMGNLGIGRPFGSMDFADAVIDRLGQRPRQLAAVDYTRAAAASETVPPEAAAMPRRADKRLVGVDVFVHRSGGTADALAQALQAAATGPMRLQMITNRGVKVWPDGLPETFCSDHWRCRFAVGEGGSITHRDIVDLLGRVTAAGIDCIKTENLCTFDGERGYALGQGQ